MDTLRNKVVVITGGSQGVGAAAARKFAAAGAKLVLVARGKKDLERVCAELKEMTEVFSVSMDVCDEDACNSLFKRVQFEMGGLHVLVNNAGFHSRGPVADVAAESLAKMAKSSVEVK